MKAAVVFLFLCLILPTATSPAPKRKPPRRRLRQQDLVSAFCMGAFVSHGLPYIYVQIRNRMCPNFCIEAASSDSSQGLHLSSSSSSSASIPQEVHKDALKLVTKQKMLLRRHHESSSSASSSSSSSDRRRRRQRKKRKNDTDWWKNSKRRERERKQSSSSRTVNSSSRAPTSPRKFPKVSSYVRGSRHSTNNLQKKKN